MVLSTHPLMVGWNEVVVMGVNLYPTRWRRERWDGDWYGVPERSNKDRSFKSSGWFQKSCKPFKGLDLFFQKNLVGYISDIYYVSPKKILLVGFFVKSFWWNHGHGISGSRGAGNVGHRGQSIQLLCSGHAWHQGQVEHIGRDLFQGFQQLRGAVHVPEANQPPRISVNFLKVLLGIQGCSILSGYDWHSYWKWPGEFFGCFVGNPKRMFYTLWLWLTVCYWTWPSRNSGFSHS